MTGSSNPARKVVRGTAGDDVEDAWLVAEAAKRSHARAAVWGVGVRLRGGHFLLLLLALLAFLAVSVGTRRGGNDGGAPPTLPVANRKENGTSPRAPVLLSTTAANKGNGVTPRTRTTTLSTATRKKAGHDDVEMQALTTTLSDDNLKNGNGGAEPLQGPTTLPVTIIKKQQGRKGAEPRAPMTVPSPADLLEDAAGAATTVDGGGGADRVAADCDMSSGRWVYDSEAYPLYKESACKFMSDQAACEKFGRTDLRYQHWRWQPHGCDLPRFDAVKLLRKLRNKRLAFVGDSLNRNQWVSMVCLIDTATPALHKYMSGNGSLVSFKIPEYNASVEFYWSPLLVESNSDHPVHHRIADRIVRAGSIGKHARRWNDADVLVFNSYLWWRRPTIKVLWGSFQQAAAHRAAYEVTDSLRAFELSIKTWSEWLEHHVDRARTRLFFMSTSPTHLHSDEWDGGGAKSNHQCYNETEPIAEETAHRGRDTDPAFARAVEAEVRRLGARGVAVRVLDVTRLSEHRKDAHPSVHRRRWEALPAEARDDPSADADCIHWCLPGVPDVWNQMLYAHIMSSSSS